MDQVELKTLLHYDPDTGQFHWLGGGGRRVRHGARAGFTNTLGYRIIVVKRVRRAAHRLAWLYVYGTLPKGVIDHINGDPSDNRISNLRDVPQKENVWNIKGPKKNNKSGFLGVSKKDKRWRATIMANGKLHYLGKFDSPELAHAAYLSAKASLHTTVRKETT